MPRMPGQRIPTIDPFAPHLSPTLARGIKELLVGPRVQEINFDFGSVLVHAPHFTAISRLIVGGLYEKGIHVVVHPVMLMQEDAVAMYVTEYDTMYFENTQVLDDEEGRATALHECVHVVCDYRRRVTAIRSEEGPRSDPWRITVGQPRDICDGTYQHRRPATPERLRKQKAASGEQRNRYRPPRGEGLSRTI